MVSELPSSLDNLAAYGVVNFDPEAYIKGTPPRYVGSPNKSCLPFEQPLNSYGITPGAQLSGHPSKDAFISKEGHSENSSWKAVLTTLVVAGAAIFTGIKLHSKFKKTPVAATPAAAAATTTATTAATTAAKTSFSTKVKNGFKTGWTKVKDFSKAGWTKFKALPTGVKIATGIVGGLAVLYGAFKTFSGHAPAAEGQPAPGQGGQAPAHAE